MRYNKKKNKQQKAKQKTSGKRTESNKSASYDPYHCLCLIKLKQETDFSTDGTDEDGYTDMPLAKNGQGEYLIRGTSLAGAMIQTARKLGHELPATICESAGGKQQLSKKSVWEVHNAHPEYSQQQITPLYRQYVKIEDMTAAAEDGGLYDMEVIPAGQTWQFLLDINNIKASNTQGAASWSEEQIALHVLHHWKQNGLMLGRRSVAGTGWFKVQSVEVVRLTLPTDKELTRVLALWPDNRKSPVEVFKQISDTADTKSGPVQKLTLSAESDDDAQKQVAEINNIVSFFALQNKTLPAPNLQKQCYWLSANIGLKAATEQNTADADSDWGLDTVSVAGHELAYPDSFAKEVKDNIAEPEGLPLLQAQDSDNRRFQFRNDHEPDQYFVADRYGRPLLPGSSIRGVLRHFMQQQQNRTQLSAAVSSNINDEKQNNSSDTVRALFGSTEQSSHLYVRDALLQNSKEWQAMVLHNHAEDEFTRAVYGSSKFTRITLSKGSFRTRVILEGKPEQLPLQAAILENAFQMLSIGMLGLGSNKWVDSGWLHWSWQEDTSRDPLAEQLAVNTDTAEATTKVEGAA